MVTTTIKNDTDHVLDIHESHRGVSRSLLKVGKRKPGFIRVTHTGTYREYVFIYLDSDDRWTLSSDEMLSCYEIEFSCEKDTGRKILKDKKFRAEEPSLNFLWRLRRYIASVIENFRKET